MIIRNALTTYEYFVAAVLFSALLFIPLLQILPFAGAIAEILVLLVLLSVVFRLATKGAIYRDWWLVAVFIVVAVVVSVLFGIRRPFPDVLMQSLIHMKFFFFYFFLSDLVVRRRISVEVLYKVLSLLFIVTIAGGLLNVAWGHGYYTFFDVKVEYRTGDLLPRLGGMQLHPNHFARTIFAFMFVMMVMYDGFSRKMIIPAAIGLFFIFFSGSRTALASVLVVPLAFFIFGRGTHFSLKFAKIFVVALFVFMLAVLASDTWLVEATLVNLEGVSSKDESEYIRGIMLYEGFQGAIERFPFGWGLTTFGTSFSLDSPVYWDIGLAGTRFVLEERGIYDSNLASVAGELGFLGVFFFLFLIWKTAGPFALGERQVPTRAYAVSLMTMLIFFMVSPIFVNDYLSLLMAVVMVYVRYRYLMGDEAGGGAKK